MGSKTTSKDCHKNIQELFILLGQKHNEHTPTVTVPVYYGAVLWIRIRKNPRESQYFGWIRIQKNVRIQIQALLYPA
jgi:hypothetical protein